MKNFQSIILYSAVIFSILSCSLSSDDTTPELSEEEKHLIQLAKTWSLGTVYYDSEDVSDRFEGFTLTLTKNKTYSTTSSRGDYDHEPFDPSGTWDFKDGNLNLIIRNDGVEMNDDITEDSLTLSFIITGSNDRKGGLGEYQFELIN